LLVRMEWCPVRWSVCLPLLISPCTIKSRSSLLALAHPGGPGKRAIKRLRCGGAVCHSISWFIDACLLLLCWVQLHHCHSHAKWLRRMSLKLAIFTFCVSHRQREMYIGYVHLCVCLSLAAFPHYCMDPDINSGNGRGCPLVVHH